MTIAWAALAHSWPPETVTGRPTTPRDLQVVMESNAAAAKYAALKARR